MKILLNKEITDEQFDNLMCQQSVGKEIKLVNGELTAVEHQPTTAELLSAELNNLLTWFKWYDNQVQQYLRCTRLGLSYDKDINQLDKLATQNQQRVAEIKHIMGN